MVLIPANINKANNYLLRLAKLFQQKIKTSQLYSENSRGKQYRQSLRFNPPPLDTKLHSNPGKSRKRTQPIK